ncbi:predicted protein [Chaetomium globosum CBS 148.51]|uniref:Uncharacterized protein n=1 Tax=Chaetomium globosum (strain ATCC 6205 / CBS 148.51 / DSM 1962 / NBRC 6347 / NRRL 1970) TaxID=306901 RepID=Q2GZ08_CHAGB|nr:uncharacterized protein CHGG_05238 [Chaetomium globosum CBS 148.51]EAQ88619.1 predicted protein [Chaetomium globosum CBS 148.51]
MPKGQVNPPNATVLVGAMAKIVERRTKTKQNIEKTKKELDNMTKKNAPQVERDRQATKIRKLESELTGWPATYETELKRWLLAQESVANGKMGSTLPQEIKNEISKYLQTSRIKQIEQEVLNRK